MASTETTKSKELLLSEIEKEIDNFLREVLKLQTFCKSGLIEKFVKGFDLWEIMTELESVSENDDGGELGPPCVFFDEKDFSPEILKDAFAYIRLKLGEPLTFAQVVELINSGGICIKVDQDRGLSVDVAKPSDSYSAETHESDWSHLRENISSREEIYFATPSAEVSDVSAVQATFSVSAMNILGDGDDQAEKRTKKKILYLSRNHEDISREDLFKMAEFLGREIQDNDVAVSADFITFLRLQEFLSMHPDIEIIDYGLAGTRTIGFIQRARQSGAFENIRFVRTNNDGQYEEILPDGIVESRFKKVCSDCPSLADTHYVPGEEQHEPN